jgi:hypothetical protein
MEIKLSSVVERVNDASFNNTETIQKTVNVSDLLQRKRTLQLRRDVISIKIQAIDAELQLAADAGVKEAVDAVPAKVEEKPIDVEPVIEPISEGQ